MSTQRVSFLTVFQEIAQSQPSAGEGRAQIVRGDRAPHVKAAERVLGSMAPQEQEDRELDRRRLLGAPARVRRTERHPASEDSGTPPHWAFDSWPFPLASLWTSLGAMALCYPLRSLIATLAAMSVGVWAGMVLDHWLRAHPSAGWRWMRTMLGVG